MIGFAGQTMEAKAVETKVTDDGRVQITLEFDDIEEAVWAEEYITKMQAKNVFQGFSDGTFRPNQPVTRVEAIVTAVRLMGLEAEAKAKSTDIKLHFKDANLIDKQFAWAKGYVVVALEQGLFDTTEDKIQPEKPASRTWVASLLVKSLGHEAEALTQMTKIPDFKDADAIRAGAVGYINVAVGKGIISGYPDGTFKPNKNVTRAEMAALLDRTNDGMLENAEAVKVNATVQAVQFTPGVKEGQIRLENEKKEILFYNISSDLLVAYHNKFIRADQLVANDKVQLVVQENQVIDAKLIDLKEPNKDNKDKKPESNKSNVEIVEFEFEAKLDDKVKVELEYKKKKDKVEAEVETESKNGKETMKGEEAVKYMETLIAKANINEKMDKTEVINNLLSVLNIDNDEWRSLELEIKFSNGKQLKAEYEKEDNDNDDD